MINNGIFLLVFALFVCIVCHYCLSGATTLTLINHGIFVWVFTLIDCIVFYYIKGHNIECDKLWNMFGIGCVCLYCVLLFKKWLGPCVPFVDIVYFFICLLA